MATFELIPQISASVIGINVTSADEEKRKVFSNIKFRQAMSVAMNRDEINEVAYYGLGKAVQYTGFSPVPDFVDPKWENYLIEHDTANSPLKKASLTGFHATAKHIAAKAVSPSSETMRTI